jgi:hypothetical protein
MTPEAQRIVIAEACGWKNCRLIPEQQVGVKPPTIRLKVIVGIQPGDDEFDGERGLPNYLSDLNAIHEAEKVLGNKLFHYPSALPSLPYEHHLKLIAKNEWYRATAAQRAEAFLRTLGKWVEE